MKKNIYDAVIITDSPSLSSVKPLGAYAIANFLRLNGYNVIVIEHLCVIPKDTLFKVLAKTISAETMFVGYSSTFFLLHSIDSPLAGTVYPRRENLCLPISFTYFDEINNYIKELNPQTKIVYGGANTKSMIEEIRKNNSYNIDYVIIGYAEQMILDFVENIKYNRSQNTSEIINDVGIIDYDQKGEHFSFRETKHVWDYSDLVLPKEPLMLEVARGCIFKCKFCTYPLLGKHIKDNSYIRTEEVLLEEILDNYEKFQTTTYLLADDTFNERTEKIELLLRVRDRSKLDLMFGGYIRLDLLARKPEQIHLLNELNFNGMFFGIETMNYQAAKNIGKGIRPEEITETLHKLKDIFGKKLMTTGAFIIGLPYDTPETVEEWTSMILTKDYPLEHYIFNALAIPNSTNPSIFFKNREKYNLNKIVNDPNPVTWKNDIWDYYICDALAVKYRNIANKLPQKPGLFHSMGLLKYGLTWEDTLNMTLAQGCNVDLVIPGHKKYINDYLSNLLNHLEINIRQALIEVGLAAKGGNYERLKRLIARVVK